MDYRSIGINRNVFTSRVWKGVSFKMIPVSFYMGTGIFFNI